jgi:hypothetical protein
VRVEHTLDTPRVPSAGFEDREDHRIPFASAYVQHNRYAELPENRRWTFAASQWHSLLPPDLPGFICSLSAGERTMLNLVAGALSSKPYPPRATDLEVLP